MEWYNHISLNSILEICTHETEALSYPFFHVDELFNPWMLLEAYSLYQLPIVLLRAGYTLFCTLLLWDGSIGAWAAAIVSSRLCYVLILGAWICFLFIIRVVEGWDLVVNIFTWAFYVSKETSGLNDYLVPTKGLKSSLMQLSGSWMERTEYACQVITIKVALRNQGLPNQKLLGTGSNRQISFCLSIY